MPGPNYVLDKGYIAQSVVAQFHAVKGGTLDETVTAVTGTTDQPIGVAQQGVVAADVNKQAIDVRELGITKAVAGGVVAKDAPVGISAAGRFVAATGAGTKVHGIAKTAAAANGDWIDVLLTPFGQIGA
jgi:hypothetical protein